MKKLIAGLGLLGLLMSSPTASETTTHTSFHVPLGKAYKTWQDRGCTNAKPVAIQSFIYNDDDPTLIYIYGADYEVRCLKFRVVPDVVPVPEPEPTPVEELTNFSLSWATPTKRENGDSLAVTALSHYDLNCNGKEYEIPADTETYLMEDHSKGPLICAMRSVDTEGLKSVWSEVVVTTL